MSSDYETAAKKLAYRARTDQEFARILAADPRRAFEKAWFLSGAEKAAYAQGAATLAMPRVSQDTAQALGKLLERARRDPVLLGALRGDPALVLEGADFLTAGERQSLDNFGVAVGTLDLRELARRSREHIRPNVVRLRVATEPYARCIAEDGEPATVFADGDGYANLYVEDSAAGALEGLNVRCHERAGVTRRRVEHKPRLRPPTTAKVRPAFTGDPRSLTKQECIRRGLPIPPPPEAADYGRWLYFIRSAGLRYPYVSDHPHRGPSAEQYAAVGAKNGTGWFGYVLDKVYNATRGPFVFASGGVNIPYVVPSTQTFYDCSSWVGIGSVYLIQTGIQFVSLPFGFNAVYLPYSWWEFWPQVGNVVSTGMPVAPDQTVWCHVLMADIEGRPGPPGGCAWFYQYDVESGNSWGWVYYRIQAPIAPNPWSNNTLHGPGVAEWIMENKVLPLIPFGVTSIEGPWCSDTSDGYYYPGVADWPLGNTQVFNIPDSAGNVMAITYLDLQGNVCFLQLRES